MWRFEQWGGTVRLPSRATKQAVLAHVRILTSKPAECEIIVRMEGRASGTQARAYATIVLLACCPCASALNPSLDVNQYAHKSWTVRDGFFNGAIISIAQTPDGYLWLGTEFGLLHFPMAFGSPRGSRPRVRNFPKRLHHKAYLPRTTGVSGSAPGKGWQVGRTAN